MQHRLTGCFFEVLWNQLLVWVTVFSKFNRVVRMCLYMFSWVWLPLFIGLFRHSNTYWWIHSCISPFESLSDPNLLPEDLPLSADVTVSVWDCSGLECLFLLTNPVSIPQLGSNPLKFPQYMIGSGWQEIMILDNLAILELYRKSN